MSPSYWGPSTWVFMHTLAAKIKETSFPVIGPSLILVLIQICNNLPCPECAQHAKEFWSKVKTANIKTKDDLINLLFVFHNIVNTYNTFSRNFNTRGNMNLINESFRRNIMLSSLRAWMMLNLSHFEF